MMNKVNNINLASTSASTSTSYSKPPPTSSSWYRIRRTKYASYLLPFASFFINNSLLVGAILDEHLLIRSPIHAMFYRDANGITCFMRSSDIHNALTDHFIYLWLVWMSQEIVICFHQLLSFELSNIRRELLTYVYKWIKLEINIEADKVLTQTLSSCP